LIGLDDKQGFPHDPVLVQHLEREGLDGCRLYLEGLRWPDGPECPRCASQRLLWLEARSKYNCRDCRYQFRVTAGTLFHDSHLSLPKWFLAVSLMLGSELGLPATRLQEILGGSYKTAWFLEHRIRAAMSGHVPQLGPYVAFVDRAPSFARSTEARPAASAAETPASWPLLQRIVAGSHRHLSPKYLTAYWNEIRWRDAHQVNPNAFRDTVTVLLAHPPVPYDLLTAPAPGTRRP
jgi:transposase-like protein